MKRNILLAVVISLILVFAGPVSAEQIPKIIPAIISAQTVAGTAYVDSSSQYLSSRANDLGGNFTLMVDAESPTGDADIQIEVLFYNEASQTWDINYFYYNPLTDILKSFTGLVIDSTLTRFTREGAFTFYPVHIPVCGRFIVRVTGVNANPADTVVTVTLVRK